MSSIKKPEIILGISNTAAIIGLTVWMYKQQSAIKSELESQAEHFKNVFAKLKEIQEKSVNREEMQQGIAHVLNEMHKKVDQTAPPLEVEDDVEKLESALESLSDILADAGVDWEYPPPKRTKKKRSKDKKKRPKRHSKKEYVSDISEDYDEDEEDDDEDEEVQRSIAQVRKRRKSKRS